MLVRRMREVMAVRYLVLTAVLALQGCITGALWHKEEVLPQLHTVTVPCEVLEVTMSADADDPSIRVRFSPQPAPEVPPHLTRFDSDRPGLFELQPAMTGDDWRQIPGAKLFAPSSWDLSITSGTYFRNVPANARMEFFGAVHPGELGELVRAEQLPQVLCQLEDELQTERAALWQSTCLEVFQAHSWVELLSPESPKRPRSGYRQVPLAWVDRDLNAVGTIEPPRSGSIDANQEVRARLRGLRLLARLDDGLGNQRYALIRVPVLLQGPDLHLRREGAAVQWSRSQIWNARLHAEAPVVEAGTPLPIPLRGESFDYRWFREIEESELALDTLRVLATPLTAALDFAIMTNPSLANLARFIAGEEQAVPFQPTVGR